MTTDLQALIQHLRGGDWNLRAPQEMADMIADKLEAALAAAHSTPEPVMVNGLTEAETNATASVAGLSPAAAAVAGDPVASQLADKLQALCDVVHEGRLVPDSDASLGYVHSAVEAAEAALTAYRMAHNAGPELVAVLESIVECHEVESGWVSDAHINVARIAISRVTKAAPHPSPSAAEQAGRCPMCAYPAADWQRRLQTALNAPGCERLREWYGIGPVQRAAVEDFLVTALSASPAEAPAEMPYGFESGLVQLLNEARCLSKETVGNRELASRIIRYMRMHAPQPVAPAGQAATAPAVERGVAEERERDEPTRWQEKCGSCANLSERQGGKVWCCRAVRNDHGAMAAAFYARRGACGPDARLFAAIPSTAGKEQA